MWIIGSITVYVRILNVWAVAFRCTLDSIASCICVVGLAALTMDRMLSVAAYVAYVLLELCRNG